MTEQSPAEAIFFAALEKGTAEERIAYVRDACGDDSKLRKRVERLLAAHPQVGNFMEAAAPPKIGGGEAAARPPEESLPACSDPDATMSHDGPSEGVGAVIAGRYKLLETLGHGGMGTVFMAQQTEPVKRLVALKLIKLGMDSRQMLARFEAERQALALMDHPNIAKVLDAGATDSGRPFFVMELVKGVPITRFCDERQLSPRERLELFIPVCHAIQHAHQKGVIHRDIKPTNVLVCLYDDRPVPKVIDFGVAKAAGSQLTDASLVTGFGAIVGTPEYMSPEQAQLNQLDIDTRSDVYALGVLLYELLTGTTPIDRKRFGQDALLEVLRVIREEEPPRPSARLSSSETLASVAATRRTEPAALTKLLRGELDWIVMKCLEKERSRRYETANGLARDLERYLHDDVVEARPPSASYRMRKFVRKHRVGISTVLAFVGLLIAAAGISTVLAIKARRAELEATRNAHEAGDNLKRARAAELGLADKLAEAQLTASSLQIDGDLAEIKADRRIGLLKLARTLKAMSDSKAGAIQSEGADQARRELREFATMAMLANGQEIRPLLPPFSHDGYPIKMDFTSTSKTRLLTAGSDRTVRLWDLSNGKQIAILRRKDEKVLGAGLSPSGATAFTDCSDGVIRLWDTSDGSFRAETDARPERVKNINVAELDSYGPAQLWWAETQLSDERVLTFEDAWQFNADKPSPNSGGRPKSPVELWDAKTGRFVARLDLPRGDWKYRFVGKGQWIAGEAIPDPANALRIDPDQSLHIFSAADGRAIAELKHAALTSQEDSDYVSPSGRILATFHKRGKPAKASNGQTGDASGDLYVELWDTVSWKSLWIAGPFARGQMNDWNNTIRLLTDDLFALGYDLDFLGPTILVRAFASSPVAVLREQIISVNMDRELVMVQSAQLFETGKWRRVQPPNGRRYHPDVAQCAPDGRFAVIPADHDADDGTPLTEIFVDSLTDKTFESPTLWSDPPKYIPGAGRSSSRTHRETVWVQRLPGLNRLDISPDLIERWAQVVVCGELDDSRTFAKWDESTWEKKRQELAAIPAPYADFPFPGHVAIDRLHWLRQEFENANRADKPRLAQELLDRAQAVGDKAEGAGSISKELNEASWAVATRPNAEEDEYRRALHWAEAAVRHVPENWDFVNTLGLLQYRNGLYKKAIATLTRSHDAHRIREDGPEPSDLAFLAMAHHALGESKEAHDYLRQLTSLCEQPAWKANEEAAGFLKEARQRLATPP